MHAGGEEGTGRRPAITSAGGEELRFLPDEDSELLLLSVDRELPRPFTASSFFSSPTTFADKALRVAQTDSYRRDGLARRDV